MGRTAMCTAFSGACTDAPAVSALGGHGADPEQLAVAVRERDPVPRLRLHADTAPPQIPLQRARA